MARLHSIKTVQALSAAVSVVLPSRGNSSSRQGTGRLLPRAHYERVAPHLKAIEDAEDVVQVTQKVRGVLRVTMPTYFGHAHSFAGIVY